MTNVNRKTTTKITVSLLMAVGIGGCAFSQMDAAEKLNQSSPITCRDAASCDRMWARLEKGIDEQTAFKFKERTATRLSQYAGSFDSVYPFVFLAERINAADGSAVVKLEIACMNPFGCFPKPQELGRSLREYIARPD